MPVLNYYAVIKSLVCLDTLKGEYNAQWYVMNAATPAASTQFWHEGMTTSVALGTAPTDAVIPTITIQGKTSQELSAAVNFKCQDLYERLTARIATPVSVAPGTTIPVQITT